MGIQNQIIPTSLPSYPWSPHEKLYAIPVNNKFIELDNRLTSTANQIALLQIQGTGTGTGNGVGNITVNWGGASGIVSAGVYTLSLNVPYDLMITSVDYTVGNNMGSFYFGVLNNNATVGGLIDIFVNSSTKNTQTTSTNLLVAGSILQLTISNVTGTPKNSSISINTKPATSGLQTTDYEDFITESGDYIITETGAQIEFFEPGTVIGGGVSIGLPGIGTVGSSGVPGATGATGAAGAAGAQGIQGSTGLQGIQGLQGLTGNTGQQGPVGSAIPNQGILVSQGSNAFYGVGQTVMVIRKTIPSLTTVILPTQPIAWVRYSVKDGLGDADINNIVVTATGKIIDGSTGYIMNSKYAEVDFVYDGVNWNIF